MVSSSPERNPLLNGGGAGGSFSGGSFSGGSFTGDSSIGGFALGLAEQMPPQGEVLSDVDIANVTAYIKSLVDTRAFPPGEMNLFLPVRTKKAFPEDEVVYRGRFTDQDGDNSQKHVLEIEKRMLNFVTKTLLALPACDNLHQQLYIL